MLILSYKPGKTGDRDNADIAKELLARARQGERVELLDGWSLEEIKDDTKSGRQGS